MNHLQMYKYLIDNGSSYEIRSLAQWVNNQFDELPKILDEMKMVLKFIEQKIHDINQSCPNYNESDVRLLLESK